MKSERMKELGNELIGAIRRSIHESRESLEARIRASDAVIGDLHAKVNALEARLAEIESKQLRRVA